MPKFNLNMSGRPLNLIDNGDGTFSFQVIPINKVKELLTASNNKDLISNNTIYLMESLLVDRTNKYNLNVSNYRKISVFISNQHDANLEVKLFKKVRNTHSSVGNPISDYISIPAYSEYCFEPTNYPLLSTPAPYLYGEIRIIDKQPTVGGLYIYVFGEE